MKITGKLTTEGKKTERDVSLYFLLEHSLYVSVYIQTGHFTQNHSVLIVHPETEKELKLLVITGLLHILAQIIIFMKRLFFVISRCVAAYFGYFRI